METVVLTGGTGMVGTALTKVLLAAGYRIIILSRNPEKESAKNLFNENLIFSKWDIQLQQIDSSVIQAADYIVHLAGAGVVAHKWTDTYKKEIVDSRVNSTKLLVQTLLHTRHHVKAFISASAIGWYGADTKDSLQFGFNEDVPSDNHFLGQICKQWELSSAPLEEVGIRRVVLRIGIVLSNNGGILEALRPPLKLGIAAIMGNGQQIVSWIHIYDLCNIIKFVVENESIQGSYNAVAPYPVSNKALIQSLARIKNKNKHIMITVPKWVLTLLMGERSTEVLKSTTVSSKKIQQAGYQFTFDTIDKSMKDLVG